MNEKIKGYKCWKQQHDEVPSHKKAIQALADPALDYMGDKFGSWNLKGRRCRSLFLFAKLIT